MHECCHCCLLQPAPAATATLDVRLSSCASRTLFPTLSHIQIGAHVVQLSMRRANLTRLARQAAGFIGLEGFASSAAPAAISVEAAGCRGAWLRRPPPAAAAAAAAASCPAAAAAAAQRHFSSSPWIQHSAAVQAPHHHHQQQQQPAAYPQACWQCGTPLAAADHFFCPQCGSVLPASADAQYFSLFDM